MKTAKDVVGQAIRVANIIYASRGYTEREGFKFWESKHPHELAAWSAACEILDLISGADVDDALDEMLDDEGSGETVYIDKYDEAGMKPGDFAC